MDTTFKPSREKWIRRTVGGLLLLVAINALGGGVYGLTGAKDVPTTWLEGSPFHDYVIPSIILVVCVGGSALLAALAVFRRHRLRLKAAYSCGIVLMIWISVQLAIIGFVSWLQPAIIIMAVLIFMFTWLLSRYD